VNYMSISGITMHAWRRRLCRGVRIEARQGRRALRGSLKIEVLLRGIVRLLFFKLDVETVHEAVEQRRRQHADGCQQHDSRIQRIKGSKYLAGVCR